MNDHDRHETVSRILGAIGAKDEAGTDELLPLVYSELRRLAKRKIAEEDSRNELEPTMLVHEAYLRLLGAQDVGWNGKKHFFGAAALAMRRVLIDQARKRKSLKHGGDLARITFSKIDALQPDSDEELIFVEEAVTKLEAADPRKGSIVNLRYYAGRSNEEVASILDISLSTVEREWRFIRSWLKSELTEFRGRSEGP